MRRTLKELALAIGGVGLGIGLFLVASGHVYSERFIGLLSFETWGYPLPWLSLGGEVYVPPTSLGLGLSVDGWVTWSAFYMDLAFWAALPTAALELSSHFALPYVMQALRLRREKRRTTATSAYGLFETLK